MLSAGRRILRAARYSRWQSASISNAIHALPLPSPDPSCICGMMACLPSTCPAQHAANWRNPSIQKEHEESNGNVVALAPYVGSSWSSIDAMLDLADFEESREERVLDIGCGDGRVLIRAIQRGAATAVGIEYDEAVYYVAQEHVEAALGSKRGGGEKIELLQGDAMKVLSGTNYNLRENFDLITLYLLPGGLKILTPWLLAALADTADTADTGSRVDTQTQERKKKRKMRVVVHGWELPLPLPTKESESEVEALQVLKLEKEEVLPGGSKIFLYS